MKTRLSLPSLGKTGTILFAFSLSLMVLNGCSSNQDQNASDGSNPMAAAEEMKDDGKGIGPVKNAEIGATIDEKMAAHGDSLFQAKCTACHRFAAEKYVGPGLKGVTKRRKPEWIMNMILNPAEMTQKDPTAKELLATHLTQMTNQNVAEPDARAIYEWFRKMDAAN
jgi:mono/diheme cytochrome c family protein